MTYLKTVFLAILFSLLLTGCIETLFYTAVPPGSPGDAPPPAGDESSASNDSVDVTANRGSDPSGTPPGNPDVSDDLLASAPAVRLESRKTKTRSTPMQPLLDEALDYCQLAQELWQKGDLDDALDALDRAYELLLRVDTEDNPKWSQQKEDIRFTISKRILEIYASRNVVVNGKHNAIPLDLNRHVQAEIKLFTGRERKFFINSYKRSGRYHTEIVRELRKAGLPEELSWVPLIESGFKPTALSPARALGLWQFIPSTGYKFGLKRNTYIDERLNPSKATKAAIAYMQELHRMFGDWTTVLAAYNCGEGRVLRVIRNQNVNYLDNFWDLYERLPRETARYVPRFLATLHIMKNMQKYGFDTLQRDNPIVNDTVTISKAISLKDAAAAIGSDTKTLKMLNPELRRALLPPDPYELAVPVGHGKALLAKIGKIPVSRKPRPKVVYHRIKRGETLSTIARRYRTSVKSIMRANGIRRSNKPIIAGKTLKIPQRGYTPQPTYASKTSRKKTTRKSIVHTVKSGDSLWILARRYNTTVKQIQRLNRLKGTSLSINQRLRIPGGKSSGKSSASTLRTYLVKSGDSPYTIARRHKMALAEFLRINKLNARSRIYPGQEVLIR